MEYVAESCEAQVPAPGNAVSLAFIFSELYTTDWGGKGAQATC